MVTFVGRKGELETLNREYEKDGFSFFPIYGRRRIGKTKLIKQFMKDKDHIYFQCTLFLSSQTPYVNYSCCDSY